MYNGISNRLATAITACVLSLAAMAAPAASTVPNRQAGKHYIVEADSTSTAVRLVRSVGGHVSRPLPIINAVAAELTPRQATRLEHIAGTRVFEDRPVKVSSSTATQATNSPPQVYSALNPAPPTPAEINATALQAAGTTGAGITIAMLDTGFSPSAAPFAYDNWGSRVLATVDFAETNGGTNAADGYGHGTQITSLIGSAARDLSRLYYGVAPGANFVIVRAFQPTGEASYTNVISGLNWIVANQAKYKIRVVNLSLGATPQSYYWNDPLNQAVMKVWQAGIVVVAAAGNSGPAGQTIDVPGNVPYVITVGAMTDSYQPNNVSAYRLASFSSVGPTYEGFVKPEIVAPGGHILATMPNDANGSITLTTEIFGDIVNPYTLFPLSGTSQATAVTSGAVALLLQSDPSLTPDQVKCKLMASAKPAVTKSGNLAYSVFQQGAGLINVLNATSTSALNCANQGLNIAADLAGTTHFGGPANLLSSGTWYIMNMQSSTPYAAQTSDGFSWSGSLSSTQVASWSESYLWADAFAWSNAYVWSSSAPWSSTTVSAEAHLWTRSLSFTQSTAVPASQPANAPFPAQEQ